VKSRCATALVGGMAQWWCRSSAEQSYSTLSPVSTGMGDRLPAIILSCYVTKSPRSTQPCIPPEFAGIKGGMSPLLHSGLASLSDLILRASSRSAANCYVRLFFYRSTRIGSNYIGLSYHGHASKTACTADTIVFSRTLDDEALCMRLCSF